MEVVDLKLRSLWRMEHRGLVGTIRQTVFFGLRFLRYSTPTKLANYWVAKTSRALRRDRLSSLPYRYTIDPTNHCNLRCPLCPTGLGTIARAGGMLKADDFTHLVDQIAPWTYLLEMYNWGEPFLHPDIFSMIRYAHDRRMVVRLSSNLNRYSPDMALKTVQSGLDAIIVSIDGATQTSYERYRKRGNLEKVLENLTSLVQARKSLAAVNPLIFVRLLINRYNENEVAALRDMVLTIGADIFMTGALFVDTLDGDQRREWLPTDSENSLYEYDDRNGDNTIENVWTCSDLWEGMVINWDGGVAPCCWLHDAKYDFANVLDQPITDIWNSDVYVTARRMFARDGAQAGPKRVICTTCRGRPQYLRM
jgi:MoaA/NifB/PqqE/SkfB family radical SAM enzyme